MKLTYLIENEKDFAKNKNAGFYVRVDRFSDSSIDMLVQAFTVTNDWGEFLKIKEELAVKLLKLLKKIKLFLLFQVNLIMLKISI